MIELSQGSCVAGQWLFPSGQRFESFDPAKAEKLRVYRSAEESEVNIAMEAARRAFDSYRLSSGGEIAGFLRTIAEEIEELGEPLLQVANQETALGIARLTNERGRTCNQLRAFADLVAEGSWVQASIDTAMPDRAPLPKPDIRRVLRPLGPVVVFGASNFPFAFGALGGDTASALAAGNPVVVKGHPSHPATSELFAHAVGRAVARCGMPHGVFSLLQGSDNALGGALVGHPLTEAVGFTGSIGGGRALMDIAASRQRPIPVYAEMGSINPVFICPKALRERGPAIASALADSVCMGAGQFCTSPGVVISLADEAFENTLTQCLTNNANGTLLNPGISANLHSGLRRLSSHPRVQLLTPQSEFSEDQMVAPNTLFKTDAHTFLTDDSLSEEIFGPVTLWVSCESEEQIAAIAEKLSGNLTATVHGGEEELAAKLADLLEQKVGRVIFNGYPTGVEVCPSMHHGGPYPASSAASTTSVGAGAIVRFARFVAWQDTPDALLPAALRNANPLSIMRQVNGEFSNGTI